MTPRKKIPTKTELVQLQKLYRTDERIGERLGGVPAYLVAYWRRKKNVPKYSQPKFSDKEVRELWERFGDDDKCGLELGISKAAFYNWRRRYGIREKPAFLKLEQLEFNFPGVRSGAHADTLFGQQTVFQKVLSRTSGLEKVEVGQEVEIEPDLAVVNDDAAGIIEDFQTRGVEYVWNPAKIVIAISNCHKASDSLSVNQRPIREFVKRQGIKGFYDDRDGIGHQVVVENGLILPGQLQLGTGEHTPSYGCVGAIGRAVKPEAMADLWATGKVTMNVPATTRIDLSGRRGRGTYTKDLVLHLMKRLSSNGASGKVIEFYGPTISHMSVSERFTLSNMSVELGAIGAVCPFDSTTRRYLTGRASNSYRPMVADKDAIYDEVYHVNIDQLVPQILTPNADDPIRAVVELEELPVNVVVLGTCSNGRFDDLRVAADILKGKKVHRDCRLLVYPGSRSIYLEALKKGLIRVFIEAGAMLMNPGCWPCHGSQQTTVGEGDRCLATSNTRFLRGPKATGSEVYLCSPATAAASALQGQITDPTRFVK